MGKLNGSEHDSSRERGGNVLFNECCTYIPNNTATDGAISKDLQPGEPYQMNKPKGQEEITPLLAGWISDLENGRE
jgi:hypothetical protein